jgi:hypothetical protein
MADEEPRKIQIDDDWKTAAQQEKERLSQEAEQARPGTVPGAASFADLVNLIVMQAMVGLGGMEGPGGQRIPPNLAMAKYHIDLLEVLEKKTGSSLEEEEKRLLETALFDLRMAYVERTERRAGPGGGASGR